MKKEINEVIEIPLRKEDVLIVKVRTKRMKVGIFQWGKNDIAHIWIDDEMYAITSKGTLIKRGFEDVEE